MQRPVTVGTLLGVRGAENGLDLDLLAGAAGLDRPLTEADVQQAGLAWAGFEEWLLPGRVLVLGESETAYLRGLTDANRAAAVRRVLQRDVPCVLLTAGSEAPAALLAEADRTDVAVLRTSLPTALAHTRLTAVLEDHLAPRMMQHGVLLDLFGLGVLLTGESGIGKSECALELVGRGHRLVADDTVEVRCRGGAVLIGTCPELTRHHVEIRGLGLVNVMDLFGVSATRTSKRVELVVRLERWESGRDYDRVGLDVSTIEMLGVVTPLVTIPIAPGRNVAVLVEAAARNHLLRARGRHAARLLAGRLEQQLEQMAERAAPERTEG